MPPNVAFVFRAHKATTTKAIKDFKNCNDLEVSIRGFNGEALVKCSLPINNLEYCGEEDLITLLYRMAQKFGKGHQIETIKMF